MPQAQAIREYKGTQFDPAVVVVFLEIPQAEINAIIENKGKQLL
jgi:response regulator RpfG family c-di-GMP phosphodiesterase